MWLIMIQMVTIYYSTLNWFNVSVDKARSFLSLAEKSVQEIDYLRYYKWVKIEGVNKIQDTCSELL